MNGMAPTGKAVLEKFEKAMKPSTVTVVVPATGWAGGCAAAVSTWEAAAAEAIAAEIFETRIAFIALRTFQPFFETYQAFAVTSIRNAKYL